MNNCDCAQLSHTTQHRTVRTIFPPSLHPLPSNRHHRSNGLERKRENYQVCSAQYCVQQLCTVQCTHIWTDLTVLWNGFCLTGPISLRFDSFFVYVLFCVWLCMGGGVEREVLKTDRDSPDGFLERRSKRHLARRRAQWRKQIHRLVAAGAGGK